MCDDNNNIVGPAFVVSNCPVKNPLERDGTSQYQRMMEALHPSYAALHEFTLTDWMKFAWHFADQLNFFSTNNAEVIETSWQRFLMDEEKVQEMLRYFRRKEAEAILEPHLALFVSFLQLIRSAQRQMNRITGRHLDFYYKKVLQLKRKEAIPDKVHLIFELAKNLSSVKLDEQALFDAGKDKNNKPLHYLIADEPVFNAAKVSAIKSVYHNPGVSLRFAEVANSADGSGTPLKPDDLSWHPFGFKCKEVQVPGGDKQDVKLPAAKPGFAFASSILFLKQGQRTITITIQLGSAPPDFDYSVFNSLQANLTVLLTGEKEWISPLKTSLTQMPSSNTQVLKFVIEVDRAEKAIVGYNRVLHEENYTTDLPVIRFLIDAEMNKGYKVYDALTKFKIISTTIHVSVEEMKDVQLENDDGQIDPSKPFLPFGPVPKKDAALFIGSPEIFSKKWKNISLNIAWKNKPDDLAKHYIAYRNGLLDETFTKNKYDVTLNTASNTVTSSKSAEVTSDEYFKVNFSYVKNNRWSDEDADKNKVLFDDDPLQIGERNLQSQNPVTGNYVYNKQYNTGFSKSKLFIQNYFQNAVIKPLFPFKNFDPGFTGGIIQQPERLSVNTKNNFLKMTLAGQYGFFHQQYPLLYAAALTIPGAVIPKEPYTPLIQSLSIAYDAETIEDYQLINKSNVQKLDSYRQRNIQLFHELPFGQAEQHVFLKEQANFPGVEKELTTVPLYYRPDELVYRQGELYVGLANAETGTIQSILFQAAEGSENPEAPSFEKNDVIEWFALCNNEWKRLNDNFILSDNTNRFLRSGIIKFLLPEEMNDDNTALPKDLRWLKAMLPKNIRPDSVCRLLSIATQASEAGFINNENDLTHLKNGLPPSTISKMVNKQAAIKSITQPFASFGGMSAESDKHFYIRVSERLRHKNRAVNIWDYERLVLEKFPSIYKVKCLNHTSSDFELQPGSVRIIPVPDVSNKNIFDPLKPKVSKNTLSEMEAYLSALNGFHVDCRAENPRFEEIQFLFNVKFYPQYDPKAYRSILEQDIKKFLAPWINNEFAEIHFGGSLYKSKAIRFIEDRPYVDFITEFRMCNKTYSNDDTEVITAFNSRAILTSYKEHSIEIIEPPVCG